MGKRQLERRPVEADYLRTLADVCPVTIWAEIVGKAVEQARQGDAAARAWLARYLCADTTLHESLSQAESMAQLLSR